MSRSTVEFPVLIVGGGPVGLSLAVDLGMRGTPCLMLERGNGSIDHPRATAINSRSMEFLRRWGVAEAVKTAGTPQDFPHTVLYVTTLAGHEIARIERQGHGGSKPAVHSPERPQRCNQLFLDPILIERARSLDGVSLRHRCHLESVEDKDDHVIATVLDRDKDERFQVAARYVVDCSGGRTVIRPALGIEMTGSSWVGYFLSVFVRAPELWAHHDKGKAALITFVDANGLWRNLVSLDGRELYRMQLTGRSYYDAPNDVDAEHHWREVIGADVPHEILSVRRWSARNVVAARYQQGNIFIAGDAAHLNHPASGIGLNTGLGDVADLGWKLSAVLSGWGGSRLLDTYEPERRPVGVRNIGHADASHTSERTQATDPAIAMDTPAGDEARRRMQEQILGPQTRRVVTDGLALGYQYADSPIVCAEGPPPPPSPTDTYQPTTLPGSRAPHAQLPDGRSTLDLFGEGFTLLRLGREAADTSSIERSFAQRNVPLKTVSVEDPAIRVLYERGLVLVRPDGHVAWRGDAVPAKTLEMVDRVRGAGTA